MDIKQLKYFLTIAQEENITAAADKLHMAQPPLSHQLRLLEEELGVKLLERGPRHSKLTEAGEILKSRAMQILDTAECAKKEMLDYSNGVRGTLSIGTVSSSGAVLLYDRMAGFHQKYPGIKFDIHESNTFTLMKFLKKGIIEIGIVRTPFQTWNLNCIYADLEPMIAVMTPENCYWDNEREIPLEYLTGKTLIVYRRFEQLLCEACEEKGFKPSIWCLNEDARTTISWAKSGFGIGIVPRSALGIFGRTELIYKPIKSERLMTRIAAVWVKDRYISLAAQKFIDHFQQNSTG